MSGAKSYLQRKSHQNRPLPERPQSKSFSGARTTYKKKLQRTLTERPTSYLSHPDSIIKNGSAIKPFDSQFSEANVYEHVSEDIEYQNIYERVDNGADEIEDTVFEES